MTSRGDDAGRGAGPGRPGWRPHARGRAAILAVVLCAIALSLAYPVREYIAQRRQIDRLVAQSDHLATRLKTLEGQRRQLDNPVVIERLARDRLHMCLPNQMCYLVIDPAAKKSQLSGGRAEPWYVRLWSSVQQANRRPQGRPSGHGHQGQPVSPQRKNRSG